MGLTSCVVSITTVLATREICNSGGLDWLRTTYHRQGTKQVAKWLSSCVRPKDCISNKKLWQCNFLW